MSWTSFRSKFLWSLIVIFLWLPIEYILLSGLNLAHSGMREAGNALLKQKLTGDLIRFRQLSRPPRMLTSLLGESLKKADEAGSPADWHAMVSRGLSGIGSGSFDLFLTDGVRLFPESEGFSPGTFSAFLASLTARADSLGSIAGFVAYLRGAQGEIDYVGNNRYSFWKWIDLPVQPGVSSRIFDDTWKADQAADLFSTPRNTWAAFGRAGKKLRTWRYLILFHRKGIEPSFFVRRAETEAEKLGIPVSFVSSRGGSSPHRDSLEISEPFEPLGRIVGEGSLPASLSLFFWLGMLANAFFSFAFLVLSWRYFHGETFDRVSVGRKLAVGLYGAVCLPVLLVVIGNEGALGAHLFREIQNRHMKMEQMLQQVEQTFERYLGTIARDHRQDVRSFRWPFDHKAGQAADILCYRHQVSTIDVISSSGVNLITYGPFSWSAFRAAQLDREGKEACLQGWLDRGFPLLRDELDMLAMDGNPPRALSRQELDRILFARGHQGLKRVSMKLFSLIARIMCDATNRHSMPNLDVEQAESGVLLNLVFKDRETQFFQEAFNTMGKLQSFNLAGYQGLSFFDTIRDRSGAAQALALIFHRLSDLEELFFYKILQSGKRPLPYSLDAISLYKGKADLGGGIGEAGKTLLRETLDHLGASKRCLLPDGKGSLRLVSIVRSRTLPGYLLVASLPLEKVRSSVNRVRHLFLLAAGFLFFLLGGIGWGLRRLLLSPLMTLQDLVRRMTIGDYAPVPASGFVGELAMIRGLFHQTMENLSQMNLARAVQESLLPAREWDAHGIIIYGRSIMMTQVGGDYFDYFALPGNRVLVVIGDVSGHGLSAAIVMAMVKSGLGVLIDSGEITTQEICRRLNEPLYQMLERKKIMTCLVGIIDPVARSFTFTNAGHSYPLLLQPSGTSRFLKQTNLALGAMRNRPYKMETVPFQPGEFLVLVTDGAIEVRGDDGKLLSFDGFERMVRGLAWEHPRRLVEEIHEAVSAVSGGKPLQDDITVLAIRQENPADKSF